MIKLLQYGKRYTGTFLLIILFLVIQALCELALPSRMAGIVDKGIAQGDISYVVSSGLVMLLLALATMAASVLITLFSGRFSTNISRDLRRDVFCRVESFSHAEFDRFSAASLITRTTGDVQQIQFFLGMMPRMLFFAPILAAGGIIRVFMTDPGMSWILAVGIAAGVSVISVFVSAAAKRFKAIQALIDRINLLTRQILTGLPVIRAFGRQQHEERGFDETNREFLKTNLVVARLMAFSMPTMMLIMNLVILLVVWAGSRRIGAGALQVGGLMALITYTMQVIASFVMISMFTMMMSRASVSMKRIREVLETETSVHDPQTPVGFSGEARALVEFRQVSFRYPGAAADTLRDISFTLRGGETTAIIGGTGSGKSTLAALLLRFYDVTAGAILVDGRDIRELRQRELREKIGYAPQRAVLLSGTVRSNVGYGKESPSPEELQRAVQAAQAEDFAAGLDREIAQGGINLSGGQKQRLSIARALVKKPEIYIFDDSFSALDFKTDAALRRALKAEAGDAALLIIAQRVGAIKNADQIIVMDEGQIAGKGAHAALMESCPVYQELALSQLTREELVS
ncbi:MAG: ABC transporter ATP-binding protein/permease [Treponema sp.]|jgi:ATP-binding cassette subfamily B protein|nr:ABC transporter ATP-binding protein/permease [Treponema sp.]